MGNWFHLKTETEWLLLLLTTSLCKGGKSKAKLDWKHIQGVSKRRLHTQHFILFTWVKNPQVNICPSATVGWNFGWFACYFYRRLCVCGSHGCQNNFQLYFCLQKVPGFAGISVQTFPTPCSNICNFFVVTKGAEICATITEAINREDWSQVIVQASWLGFCVWSTIDRKSDIAGAGTLKSYCIRSRSVM